MEHDIIPIKLVFVASVSCLGFHSCTLSTYLTNSHISYLLTYDSNKWLKLQ